MKLSVEFPSVCYREGPAAVGRLAAAIERIGYDYADHDAVIGRVIALRTMGFGWVALNATAIFQAGARTVDAIIDSLATLHDKIRAEIG